MIHQCQGDPSFDLRSSNSFTEWPSHLSGYVCKTPPIGIYNAPNFSKCCSGTAYDITRPTNPDDPAYPMTCAIVCQVDPAFDANNPQNPYGFSDYFMCLMEGYSSSEEAGDVVCADLDGIQPSFRSTPTGPWMTRTSSETVVSLALSETEYPMSPVSQESGNQVLSTLGDLASSDIFSAQTPTVGTESDLSSSFATTTFISASKTPSRSSKVSHGRTLHVFLGVVLALSLPLI